jgi:predicted amidohydrolase YtcJ
VVLAADPRRVPTDAIGEIEIVETIARGRTVFSEKKEATSAGR